MSIQEYARLYPILLTFPSPKGKVELIETVGKGNYGYVYKGKLLPQHKDELAAIKVVFLKQDEIKETLLEMEILQDCHHPNITSYHGCFLKGLRWSFAELDLLMQFIEVTDYADTGFKKELDEDVIASIFALEYIHTKVGLIHRDIKAGNILLTIEGHVKVADFGVSARLKKVGGSASTFIGTPYEVIACDPDAASSGSYTDKSDIWSLGITAIEIAGFALSLILEKNPPLSDLHPMQALSMIAKSDIGLARPKKFSKGFVDFVNFLLVKDPFDRPNASQAIKHPFMVVATEMDRRSVLRGFVETVVRIREMKKKGTEITEKDEVSAITLRPTMQMTLATPTLHSGEEILKVVAVSDFPAVVNHVSEGGVLEPVSLTSLAAEGCTADFLDGQYILLGCEKGMKIPAALIHDVKFTQIQVLQEYNVLIALSGRHSHIRQYSLSTIRKLILFVEGNDAVVIAGSDTSVPIQNVAFGGIRENEYGYLQDVASKDEATLVAGWTNDFIKIPDTKESRSFLVEETESSAYLTIVFSQAITLFRWATKPYKKFMKVKSFWVPETPVFVSFGQDGVSAVDLFIGYATELNKVLISDSKVSELILHKEMERGGGTGKMRWRSIKQIPFSDAKLEVMLKEATAKGTMSRKLAALSGPTLNRQSAITERYFLATFSRLTRVVDAAMMPQMGAGVGGWKDGVMWSEPPITQILRPLQHVMSIGKTNIEIVEWKTAALRQRLSVDSTSSFKLLSSRHGYILVAVERKKKGFMIYWMRESSEKPRPAGELMKKIGEEGIPKLETLNGTSTSLVEPLINRLQNASVQETEEVYSSPKPSPKSTFNSDFVNSNPPVNTPYPEESIVQFQEQRYQSSQHDPRYHQQHLQEYYHQRSHSEYQRPQLDPRYQQDPRYFQRPTQGYYRPAQQQQYRPEQRIYYQPQNPRPNAPYEQYQQYSQRPGSDAAYNQYPQYGPKPGSEASFQPHPPRPGSEAAYHQQSQSRQSYKPLPYPPGDPRFRPQPQYVQGQYHPSPRNRSQDPITPIQNVNHDRAAPPDPESRNA